MSRQYEVKTEKWGTITIMADDIAEARRHAKSAYGVGPQSVTAGSSSKRCDSCDSAPCTCSEVA